MKNLLTAIYQKTINSNLSTDVDGRIYPDQAPHKTEYPYIVYSIISNVPDRTFTEYYTDTLIQFSLFSASSRPEEITTMYKDLKALFDEQSLTITDNTLVWMREQNLITMINDILIADATVGVKHWAVDFEVLTSLK
jgi:hypothetical protein